MTLHARQAPGKAPYVSPYDHTENNAPSLRVTTSILFGLALFFVIVRSYVRIVMTKTIGSDDWAMVAAMVCTRNPPEDLSSRWNRLQIHDGWHRNIMSAATGGCSQISIKAITERTLRRTQSQSCC